MAQRLPARQQGAPMPDGRREARGDTASDVLIGRLMEWGWTPSLDCRATALTV